MSHLSYPPSDDRCLLVYWCYGTNNQRMTQAFQSACLPAKHVRYQDVGFSPQLVTNLLLKHPYLCLTAPLGLCRAVDRALHTGFLRATKLPKKVAFGPRLRLQFSGLVRFLWASDDILQSLFSNHKKQRKRSRYHVRIL